MPVDSFKYLPRLIQRYYQATKVAKELPIPFTPLAKPLAASRFALVTSGGLYHKSHEPPFDLEGEQARPAWGDPSFRTLPVDIAQAEVGASHWHINTAGVLADLNVLLPVNRFQELALEGRIGGLAPHAFSFMGYQGFPSDLRAWREVYAPQTAHQMRDEGVDCVFLTTA
jgi:D-proline reductase (dithiol) PrdB